MLEFDFVILVDHCSAFVLFIYPPGLKEDFVKEGKYISQCYNIYLTLYYKNNNCIKKNQVT